MITDPIANALTNIRNCVRIKKKNAQVVVNNTIIGILNVLLDNGFIKNFTVKTLDNKSRVADIELKYSPDPAIVELKRVSKPGRRIYSKCGNIPKIYNNLGIFILSTNRGIISNKQAKRENVGGELLCSAF